MCTVLSIKHYSKLSCDACLHSIYTVLSAGCTAPNMKTQVFKILTLLRTETKAPLDFKGLFFGHGCSVGDLCSYYKRKRKQKKKENSTFKAHPVPSIWIRDTQFVSNQT